MSFNIWSPQGQMSGLGSFSNPNVIYEAGAKILSGTVFKMWATQNNGAGGLYYFESLDGLTSWTAHPSNPIGSGTGFNFPTVYHIGSTYYCYSGPENDQIYVRTSSDGITWGSATSVITRGTAGQWDDTDISQLNLVSTTPIGGLYYGYYAGIHTGVGEGLVTASSLTGPWTKSPSNPIFNGVAPMAFQVINNTYFAWAPNSAVPPSVNPGLGSLLNFNALARWSAPTPSGPWTVLTIPGNPSQAAAVIYPTLRADFDISGTNTNTTGASIQDECMLSALGNIYIYWTRSNTQVSNQFGINAAVATGVTPAQQVSGYEGMVGFPLPMFDGNLNVLASDNFQRADSNPIGGNWSPLLASGVFSQIVSHFVEAAAAPPSNGLSFWNAIAWPNDQWSQVTLQTCSQNSVIGAEVRMSTSGANTDYKCLFTGGPGGLGNNGSLNISKTVAGTGTTLGGLSSFKMNQGDTIMMVVSGTNLLVYYNGFPVLAATDASTASGASGMWNSPNTAVANSQISAWRGGGFQAAPLLTSSGQVGAFIVGL